MGYTIAALLGLLLLLILIALFLKTTYSVDIKKEGLNERLRYNVQFSWLSGIIKRGMSSEKVGKKEDAKLTSKRKTVQKKKEETQKKKQEVKKKEKPKKKSKFSKGLGDLGLNSIINIVGYSIELLKKVFAIFVPKKAYVYGRYGAKEPDTTGMVLAVSYALAALLPLPMHIEPEFEKEELQFDVQLIGYFRLWAVFMPAVKYILKPEIWGLIFPRRTKKKRRKKAKKVKNNWR